jgi:hypothetical protein
LAACPSEDKEGEPAAGESDLPEDNGRLARITRAGRRRPFFILFNYLRIRGLNKFV